MPPSSHDLKLCKGEECSRWWYNTAFQVPGSPRPSSRCPYCREVSVAPTKYWIGGPSGAKEGPGYDYPTHVKSPVPIKTSDERSVKRSTPFDDDMAETPRPTKMRKLQQQPTPVTPASLVEEAKMKRKDSLTSPSQQSPVTPTPKQDMALQAILAKSTHLYEAWKRCKGSPSSHLQSELTSAHSNVQALRVTVCNIESKLKTSQSELSAAESKMDKMKVFWEKTRTAAKEAGLEGDKDHDEWLLSGAHKPVQRAYEDHHRKKEQHDKIVHDLTKAQSLLANAELRVVEIEEERKQVKFFGEFYRDELLPSKNAA